MDATEPIITVRREINLLAKASFTSLLEQDTMYVVGVLS